jgi:excisionase family DNA binding protein
MPVTRLHAAIVELVEALRAELPPPRVDVPDRLLDVKEAAAALGIGRSTIYQELDAGRLRSLKVGRRRLVPSSATTEYINGAGA